MAIALPIGTNDQILGTGFVAGYQKGICAVVTALHVLGGRNDLFLFVPPHGGDVSKFQIYPQTEIQIHKAVLAITEPLLDLAVLLIEGASAMSTPGFIKRPEDVSVGEEMLVVGYPLSVLGSVLETVEPCTVSALGIRLLQGGMGRPEYILSRPTHSGSSGSPVIRRRDGVVAGVVRGCLASPSSLSIGNIPLGTDTNVTYAVSSHVIPALIESAFKRGVVTDA